MILVLSLIPTILSWFLFSPPFNASFLSPFLFSSQAIRICSINILSLSLSPSSLFKYLYSLLSFFLFSLKSFFPLLFFFFFPQRLFLSPRTTLNIYAVIVLHIIYIYVICIHRYTIFLSNRYILHINVNALCPLDRVYPRPCVYACASLCM